MAPGGDYSRLAILHFDRCPNDNEDSDNNIQSIIRYAGYTTFEEIETAVRGILMARRSFECNLYSCLYHSFSKQVLKVFDTPRHARNIALSIRVCK